MIEPSVDMETNRLDVVLLSRVICVTLLKHLRDIQSVYTEVIK